MKFSGYNLLSISLLVFVFSAQADQEKYVRGSRPYGLFSDFLLALNHIQFCVENNKTPVIYWGERFSYYSRYGYNGSLNGWEYYFEPVSDQSYVPGDELHTEIHYRLNNKFSTLWWYVQYIDNKHQLSAQEQLCMKAIEDHNEIYLSKKFNDQRRDAFGTGSGHLYSTQLRHRVKRELIDRFIRIKPVIMDKIEHFYRSKMAGKKTVGIHLRGGHILGEVLPVPLEYIFAAANEYADLGYQFYIATDQAPLIAEAKKHLRGNVIFYECQRFGKTTSPNNNKKKLDPKLGEDLLIETILLSQCDHFIHTLSNVSTAVLYFNPDLSHTLIY